MKGARCVAAIAGFLLSASADPGAQEPPLTIGTRVGERRVSGYDPEGRRDPFASLIVTPTAGVEPEPKRAQGLAGVAVADAVVTGIVVSGTAWLAIVAGPDGEMYVARTHDRLHDAVIRRIDGDAVVFLATVRDGAGNSVSREVRKALRPTTGAG